MAQKEPILRDFILTKTGYIFAVCDYFHPENEVRSILRYVPDKNGDCVCKKKFANSEIYFKKYRKLGFDESFEYIKKHKPEWIKDVICVPEDEIVEILKPTDAVFNALKNKYKESYISLNKVISFFYENGIPYEYMGVTGSILAGLEGENSDIDFIVYGDYWKSAQQLMKHVSNGTGDLKLRDYVSSLDLKLWRQVYEKRNSPLSFELFLKHEKRKYNRGMVDGKYFDILYVRDKDETFVKRERGIDKKRVIIEAIVTDDFYAFDNPAQFKIENNDYFEVLSYTHSYTGQALKGEKIFVSGIEEDLGDKKRIVVGTSREPENEWIISCFD